MTHLRDDNVDDKGDVVKPDAPLAAASPEKPDNAITPNPPRTTSFGWLTTPKFGSAGSGGFELEPGPERD